MRACDPFPPARDDAAAWVLAVGRQLFELHADEGPATAAEWIARALGRFAALVPFASAWWGQVSDGDGQEPAQNWQHGSLGLAAGFAQEWNAISAGDEYASASMSRLGEVCLASGHDACGAAAIADFSRRHGLYHAMAITFELPDSGLLFFVALYRGEGERAFDALEAAVFGEFCRHLMHGWYARLRGLLRAASVASAGSFALCERSGRVLYVGARLARALRREFADWQGSSRLPAPVLAQCAQLPCTLRLGRHGLSAAACGELIALSFSDHGEHEALAPRERAVALLYAAGESYKAIAARLGLSPATVRTYLRDAYLQLGVRNKVELGARMAQDGADARR